MSAQNDQPTTSSQSTTNLILYLQGGLLSRETMAMTSGPQPKTGSKFNIPDYAFENGM